MKTNYLTYLVKYCQTLTTSLCKGALIKLFEVTKAYIMIYWTTLNANGIINSQGRNHIFQSRLLGSSSDQIMKVKYETEVSMLTSFRVEI